MATRCQSRCNVNAKNILTRLAAWTADSILRVCLVHTIAIDLLTVMHCHSPRLASSPKHVPGQFSMNTSLQAISDVTVCRWMLQKREQAMNTKYFRSFLFLETGNY